MTAQTAVMNAALTWRRAADLVALTKPRVVSMVLVTTGVGFYLGCLEGLDLPRLAVTLLGTGLAAAGTLALNQYLERDLDARMHRTRTRPLPDGRLQPGEAVACGAGLTVLGVLCLALAVNHLSAAVTAVITVSYLFVYTPLKTRTSLCSVVGAVPGALPPVVGWAAARGNFGVEAFVLFAILFLWQLPHSLAIAWLYRDDYARAGMAMLPVIERDGYSTGRQIMLNSMALVAVAMLPTFVGVAGQVYLVVAVLLSVWLLATGVRLAAARTPAAARQLLLVTLAYLPALLLVMALDKVAV